MRGFRHDEDLEGHLLHSDDCSLFSSLLLGHSGVKEFAVMAAVFCDVMLPSKTALMEMLIWAKDSYRGAIVPKDAGYWRERIEELKGLI